MRNIALFLTYLGTAITTAGRCRKICRTVAETHGEGRRHGGWASGAYDGLRPDGRGCSCAGVRGEFPHVLHHPGGAACPMR